MTETPNDRFHFSLENEEGQLVVKGEISGTAAVPSLDDLKFQAVIALLHSVDKKNFSEVDKVHLFDQSINEIQETITEMKKHDQFQGETR